MIEIKNISLFLGKQKPALTVSHLELVTGLWALVGRNGAGKSTFLNTISGFNEHYSGDVFINHKDLKEIPKTELASQISVVLSKTEIFGNLTGLDVLFLGRLPYQNLIGHKTQQDVEVVNQIIDELQLKTLVSKPFSVLSDGEKQLIMIGRALVQNTPIIILDEPTAFLDVVNRKKIVKLLHKISSENNKLILFSTHNIDLIETFCDGMLMINENHITKIEGKHNFKTELDKLFKEESI